MSMRSSLVSDCNLLIKKASTRKGEAFCVKGNDTSGAIVNDRRLNKDPERGGSDDEIRFFYDRLFCEYVCYSTDKVTNRKTALLLTR